MTESNLGRWEMSWETEKTTCNTSMLPKICLPEMTSQNIWALASHFLLNHVDQMFTELSKVWLIANTKQLQIREAEQHNKLNSLLEAGMNWNNCHDYNMGAFYFSQNWALVIGASAVILQIYYWNLDLYDILRCVLYTVYLSGDIIPALIVIWWKNVFRAMK